MEKPESTAERVGGYRVVRRLATGGTSDVLLAKAEGPHGFERTVVLKLLLSQYRNDEEFAQMFAREASAYARLSHPSIVRLFDFFQLDGQLVMVLEYVDGPPLNRLRGMLRAVDAQLDDRASIHVAGRIFDALAAAHSVTDEKGDNAPVVHRDVNPSNVLVAWGGHVKLADFGIAKVTGSKHESRLGIIKGTYGYMAPEQVRGELVTPRADIYAGGVILWELLTRRRAFQRGALPEVEVLRQMAEPKITSLDVLRPDVDRSVREAVRRALEPDPQKRTISADEIVGILRGAVPTDAGRESLQKALASVRHEPKPLPSIPPPAPSSQSSAPVHTPRSALPKVGLPPRANSSPVPTTTAPLGSFKSEPPTRRTAPSLNDVVTSALAQAPVKGGSSIPPATPKLETTAPTYQRRNSVPDGELESMPGLSIGEAINEILDSMPNSAPPMFETLPKRPLGHIPAAPPPMSARHDDDPISSTVAMPAPVVPPQQVSTAPMLAYSKKPVIGLEAAAATPSPDAPQKMPYGPPPTPQQPNAPPPGPAQTTTAKTAAFQPPTPLVPSNLPTPPPVPVPRPQMASSPQMGPPQMAAPPPPPMMQTAMMPGAPMQAAPPPQMAPPPMMSNPPMQPPSAPPVAPAVPRAHPSSLSGHYASMAEPPPAPKSRSGLAIVAVLFTAALVAVGGVVWYMRSKPEPVVATPPPPSVSLPSTAIVVPSSTSTVTTTTTPIVSATVSAAPTTSAPPPPSASTAPPAGDIPAGMGVVKTEGAVAGRRVFIDDKVVGQTPESFTVKCGTHQIRVGSSGHAHSIEIPCGGEITAAQ